MGGSGVRHQARGRSPSRCVKLFGPDAAGERADLVSALYREAFGAPPNNEGEREFAHQRAAYARLLSRPGFRLALAFAAGRDRVVDDAAKPIGFAYGALLTAGTRWWDGLRGPRLPAGFTDETGRRTFAIIDMGVLPSCRGRGIGRALHDTLLRGCGAERATLSVEPRLTANQRRYRSWGWRWVGRLPGGPTDIADVYDIYLLEDRVLLGVAGVAGVAGGGAGAGAGADANADDPGTQSP